MKRHPFALLAMVCCVPLLHTAAMAQFDDVAIQITHIAGSVHMLEGRGGKLAVCIGDDGAFLVDDQYAPLAEKISAAVATLTDKPIRFILNTHWHGDHTGGNEKFGAEGVVLVAHQNVRQRLSSKQFVQFTQSEVLPQPATALPIVTFSDELRFHLNGEGIRALHVRRAHTDGDAVVFFSNANVLHAGDVYFAGMYPFIDLSSGGSIDGLIEAIKQVLELVDDQTRIIPGHGPVGGRADLQAYHNMLLGVRAAVRSAVDAGASLAETISRKPTADYDAAWGKGWIKPDQMVEFVYQSLTSK
jgi:glyoxylase-like metal-dependent hydrolase (beta-lactamase superfamily II)